MLVKIEKEFFSNYCNSLRSDAKRACAPMEVTRPWLYIRDNLKITFTRILLQVSKRESILDLLEKTKIDSDVIVICLNRLTTEKVQEDVQRGRSSPRITKPDIEFYQGSVRQRYCYNLQSEIEIPDNVTKNGKLYHLTSTIGYIPRENHRSAYYYCYCPSEDVVYKRHSPLQQPPGFDPREHLQRSCAVAIYSTTNPSGRAEKTSKEITRNLAKMKIRQEKSKSK